MMGDDSLPDDVAKLKSMLVTASAPVKLAKDSR
jgi:hypothetical protein